MTPIEAQPYTIVQKIYVGTTLIGYKASLSAQDVALKPTEINESNAIQKLR